MPEKELRLFRALASVATSDGAVRPLEQDLLEQYREKLGLTPQEAQEIVRSAGQPDFPEDPEERLKIFFGCVEMACADGELRDGEKALLSMLAKRYEIPDETLQGLLRQHLPPGEALQPYRQDAHFLPLVAWALLCAVAAGVLGYLIYHKQQLQIPALVWTEYAGIAALVLLGPVAFVLYIVRSRMVWVRVDPAKGLIVSDRYVIPWQEIREVERKRPALRAKGGAPEMKQVNFGDTKLGGCGDLGGCGGIDGEGALILIAIVVILIAVVALAWFIVAILIPLLIIPVLEVFTPFGDRVKIVGTRRSLVLRDLRDPDGLLAELAARVPVNEK